MNIAESLRCAATWFRERQQRSIERQQAEVELSLFALYAGINPAELRVYPDELFSPLPHPVTDCIINPEGAFLTGDVETLEDARNRLLGLVKPELRAIINCSALQAAADILAEQLRNRSDPLREANEDFTKAAITRQLFIKSELARVKSQ